MRAIELLVEDYKTTAARFATQGGSQQDITARIQRYRELLARNQIRDANQKQIDWWAKQGWAAFDAFVKGFEGHVTATQVKRRKLVGDSIILRETNDWLVVIPLDKEASCFHGKNSDWCVTKPQHPYWEEYFHDSKVVLVYILGKNGQGMWALAGRPDGEIEIFNQKDDTITDEELKSKTGFSAEAVMAEAMARYGKRIEKAQIGPAAAVEEWLKSDGNTRTAEIERDVVRANNPALAVRYMHRIAKAHGAQSWPENLMKLAFTMYVPSDQPDDVEDDDWEDPRDEMRLRWGRVAKEVLALSSTVPASVEDIIIRYQPDLAQFVKNPSHDFIQRIALRSKQAFETFYGKGLLDEKTIIKALSSNPYRLSVIKDPTEEMKLAAINGSMYASVTPEILKLIDNPSEEVQMAAVMRYPDSIMVIKNPSKKVILKMLEREPNMLSRLDPKDVDEEVLRKAFATSWVSAQYLPRDKDQNRISIPPKAQMELARSFFKKYLSYGDGPETKGHRTSMLKYNYSTVDDLLTDDRAKRFFAALRKKYERD